MKSRLIFASALTLGILASFVFFVFYLIAFSVNLINFGLLIVLTVLTNVVLWLVSPYITDLMQGWFYRIQRLDFPGFSLQHPQVAVFIKEVCSRNNIPLPALRIIQDNNPTAFCYGSYPANARLVVSEGIFKYLNVEEQKAVFAHELGHIVNLDFIVMTVATTLLQILYEVYYKFLRTKRRSSGKKDPTPFIGVVAYVLYLAGSYLVLYLSRTREYLADRFSAHETQDPDSLSMALIKIAYGISSEVDSEATGRLLAATRQTGIYDYKTAYALGSTFKMAIQENGSGPKSIEDISRVFLFDIYSPWAKVAELHSTHPLTGKRIKALSDYSVETPKPSMFDFVKLANEGEGLDRKKMYRDFEVGAFVYLLPFFAFGLALAVVLSSGHRVNNYPLAIAIMGFAFLFQGVYKFKVPSDEPERTTVFKLMQNPYANPLRGRYVEIEGKVIGKADAGSYFGEDLTMLDASGCLIYLNYESIVPFVGNLIFGTSVARKTIGEDARAVGWFRRSTFQVIDLDRIEIFGQTIRSYACFWGIILGLSLLALSAIAVLWVGF